VVGLNAIPYNIFWQSCEQVLIDVKDEVNNATLGLYSFRVFVDCVWSAQKITAPKRRNVEVVEDIQNVNPVAGIMTWSQKKLTSVSAGLQM
jgi:hypothetical protein